jgi:hypothetical protein
VNQRHNGIKKNVLTIMPMCSLEKAFCADSSKVVSPKVIRINLTKRVLELFSMNYCINGILRPIMMRTFTVIAYFI